MTCNSVAKLTPRLFLSSDCRNLQLAEFNNKNDLLLIEFLWSTFQLINKLHKTTCVQNVFIYKTLLNKTTL